MAVLILTVTASAMAANYLSLNGAKVSPLITTVDDPANHLVTAPSVYDGVAKIIFTFPNDPIIYGASGSLLSQGGNQYLLTAGLLVSENGNFPNSFSVTFSGGGSYIGTQYFLPPGWNGDYLNGYDIALVKLNAAVPLAGYNIMTTEISSPTTGNIAGCGLTGMGNTGSVVGIFGTLRQGQNTFGEAQWIINGNPYVYDFDNGQYYQNSILSASQGNIPSDYGLETNEVIIALGDSGGPTFINGEIAGVHSFFATSGPPYDIDDKLNSSFGELGGDTRVAEFASWINSVTVAPAPLPGAGYLLASGLGFLALWGRNFP